MSKYRRAAKVDRNQPAIVDRLLEYPGVSVALKHDDILVGYGGQTFWYEIKADRKAEIKPSQKKLAAEWQGHYAIVTSAEEIIEDIRRKYRPEVSGDVRRVFLPRPADGLLRAVGAAAEGERGGMRAEEGKAVG
jgi:hypothetical protein